MVINTFCGIACKEKLSALKEHGYLLNLIYQKKVLSAILNAHKKHFFYKKMQLDADCLPHLVSVVESPPLLYQLVRPCRPAKKNTLMVGPIIY